MRNARNDILSDSTGLMVKLLLALGVGVGLVRPFTIRLALLELNADNSSFLIVLDVPRII